MIVVRQAVQTDRTHADLLRSRRAHQSLRDFRLPYVVSLRDQEHQV